MRQHNVTFVFVIVFMSAPCIFSQEIAVQITPSSDGSVKTVVVGPDGKPMVVPDGTRVPAGASPAHPGKPTPPKKEDDKSKKADDDNRQDFSHCNANVKSRLGRSAASREWGA